MRAFKLLTTGLVLAVIGLFFWQNAAVFKTIVPFALDLYIHENVTWSHQLYTLLLIAGGLGLIMGIILMLKPYFKVRRLLAEARQEREQAKASMAPPPKTEPVGEKTQEQTAGSTDPAP